MTATDNKPCRLLKQSNICRRYWTDFFSTKISISQANWDDLVNFSFNTKEAYLKFLAMVNNFIADYKRCIYSPVSNYAVNQWQVVSSQKCKELGSGRVWFLVKRVCTILCLMETPLKGRWYDKAKWSFILLEWLFIGQHHNMLKSQVLHPTLSKNLCCYATVLTYIKQRLEAQTFLSFKIFFFSHQVYLIASWRSKPSLPSSLSFFSKELLLTSRSSASLLANCKRNRKQIKSHLAIISVVEGYKPDSSICTPNKVREKWRVRTGLNDEVTLFLSEGRKVGVILQFDLIYLTNQERKWLKRDTELPCPKAAFFTSILMQLWSYSILNYHDNAVFISVDSG